MNKVLVLGASGFIGRRLVPALLEAGVAVRGMVRKEGTELPAGCEKAVGDLLREASLPPALAGIDTVYYLVHAMGAGQRGFAERDRRAAGHFVGAAVAAGVRRVIYLGALGDERARLSEHLASRAEVARILATGDYALTVLRAAVIIGAGSASFEMIRALVHRLPIMPQPPWLETRCQPIAVGDVIRYLVGCLLVADTAGRTFDICGEEIFTYKEMMEAYARLAGEVNLYLPVPFLTPKLSSYLVGRITPVPGPVSMSLMEGLSNEVICHDQRLRQLMPFPLTPYAEAVRQALRESSHQ
jgi:uncharacterized protein YbjT (DUF2867 family)